MGWYVRLLEEKYELHCRMVLLNRFNHSTEAMELPEDVRVLLIEQYRAMQRYYGILNRRCELYTKPGGADEGQPVKGDTAKDGGQGCKACGGTGEVLAEECGVCRENF